MPQVFLLEYHEFVQASVKDIKQHPIHYCSINCWAIKICHVGVASQVVRCTVSCYITGFTFYSKGLRSEI